MKLELNVGLVRGLKLPDDVMESFGHSMTYKRDEQTIELPADTFTEEQLKKITAWCQKHEDEPAHRSTMLRVATFLKLKSNPEGESVARLEALATALKLVIGKCKNKWLYQQSEDGHALPMMVKSIRYIEPERDSPASTRLEMCYTMRGEKMNRNVCWHSPDLKGGKNPVKLLNEEGLFLETDAMDAEYDKTMRRMTEISGMTGEQFSGLGEAFQMGGYYSRGIVSLTRDGEPTKLVMDDDSDEDEKSSVRRRGEESVESNRFWTNDTQASCVVPEHPYVKCFDLSKHEFVRVHVLNLTPYEYVKGLADKLVLPAEKKDLVTVLVQGANELLEDIVRGKTGGIIVFATGEPGTGKTLTAEIYAEEIHRPLYVVQCSQLGVDEETLEKRLQKVLARAMRWKAILLIDEADVYVHERGDEIHQNAIIGVFLRVLEYYRGVLFMTSNRATVVDDAIMSRATAHIRYEIPTPEELKRIWAVLSKQFGVKFTPTNIEELVERFPGISGRNVKNLLKLARLLAQKRNEPVSLKLVEHVARFIDLANAGGGKK